MNDMTPGISQKRWPADPRYIAHVDGTIVGPSGRKLKPRVHMHGYIRMSRVINGDRTDEYVHRIVCETFHGPPIGDANQVDHINGIRSDNRAENLRWVTKKENLADRNIPCGENHCNARITDQQVRNIRAAHGNHSQIANVFGISREQVRDIKSGKARKNA